MKSRSLALLAFAIILAAEFPAPYARAVLLYSSASDPGPDRNLSAPTGDLANSGWQFQGVFDDTGALGTPIAPNYFITASHVGGAVGDTFSLNSATYTTDAKFSDPSADLTIWHVSTPFPSYAPLYTSTSEAGQPFIVFGLGGDRGASVSVASTLKGWQWGTPDGQQSWGTNTIADVVTDPTYGPLLQYPFDPTTVNSCELSGGDSGGGLFIDNAGSWQLAGINLGVDSPFKYDPSDPTSFDASLFDTSGLYEEETDGSFAPAPDAPANSYDTPISQNLAFIDSVVPEPTPLSLLPFAAAAALLKRKTHPRLP
jgi:hypothetical protein